MFYKQFPTRRIAILYFRFTPRYAVCVYCSRSLNPACFRLIYLFRWYINRYSAQINDVPIHTYMATYIIGRYYYQLVLWVLLG